MRDARFISIVTVAGATLSAIFLSSCGTTTSSRALPAYETPIAKAGFQTVRTTAYTHTESDHLEYTNHNALGGELRAAGPPVHRPQNTPRELTLGIEQASNYSRASYSGGLQPFAMNDQPVRKAAPVAKRVTKSRKIIKIVRGKRLVIVAKPEPPQIGSAAADWSRWPAGTTFRLVSTGQLYRVDDYGWALAGRNTIDLYMATPAAMNSWGARDEEIQILQWGDSRESLRLLTPHTEHKHIRRMVLELEGRGEEAAALR